MRLSVVKPPHLSIVRASSRRSGLLPSREAAEAALDVMPVFRSCKPSSVTPDGLHDRKTGMTSSAASAASLLGRRPLRRELARTIDKCGGLTTDNLIEGGQETIRFS